MTCPTCGGVVEDHVCTNCGAAVWPQTGDEAPGPVPPPPPSSAPPAAPSGGPTFVNPPDAGSPATPPPPPPPPPGPVGTPAAGGWQPSTPVSGGTTGKKKSSALWWILGGVALLAVLGVVAVVFVLRSAGVALDDLERVGDGSPERLAVLWDNCEQGDMQACDDLYLESPIGSTEESFGDTCGNRNEPSGWCVDIHGDTAPAG